MPFSKNMNDNGFNGVAANSYFEVTFLLTNLPSVPRRDQDASTAYMVKRLLNVLLRVDAMSPSCKFVDLGCFNFSESFANLYSCIGNLFVQAITQSVNTYRVVYS